jgi:hypothetical protein
MTPKKPKKTTKRLKKAKKLAATKPPGVYGNHNQTLLRAR